MEKFLYFISGLIVGMLIFYFLNKFKKIREENNTLKNRNIHRLNVILVAILVSYGITALIAIPLGSWIHIIIGIAFAVFVVVLGIIAVVGLYLIKDNYTDTKKESDDSERSDMISVGESLIGLALQLLIGTMAVGLITLLVQLV